MGVEIYHEHLIQGGGFVQGEEDHLLTSLQKRDGVVNGVQNGHDHKVDQVEMALTGLNCGLCSLVLPAV